MPSRLASLGGSQLDGCGLREGRSPESGHTSGSVQSSEWSAGTMILWMA
jgi:hypothetical protein